MKELADWLTRGTSLEAGRKLPYLGSGSIAGIEALARLAAAGVEIGFDPGAMGGGDDPLDEYFKKIEGGSPDQIAKFLQWAEIEGKKGTRTVSCQGISLPLNDYKSRLEGIHSRKQQVAPEGSIGLARPVTAPSLRDQIQVMRRVQNGEAEAKKKKEKEEAMEQLRPEAISQRLRHLVRDFPLMRESVALLEKARAPQLMSEVSDYLMDNGSDRLVGRSFILQSHDRGQPYRLVARNIGTEKEIPVLCVVGIPEALQNLNVTDPTDSVLSADSSLPIEGAMIKISQNRRIRFVAEQCFGFAYPIKEGDEFYLEGRQNDTALRIYAGKTKELTISVSAFGGVERALIVQPDEISITNVLIDILAGLKK